MPASGRDNNTNQWDKTVKKVFEGVLATLHNEDRYLLNYSFIFIPNFPLGRVPGAATLGGLLRNLTVNSKHQTCNHGTWSRDDF